MDKKLLLSIGLLFIVLITQYAHCAPAEDKEDDSEYLQDADEPVYDEYEDDDSKKSFSTSNPDYQPDVYKSKGNFTLEVETGKIARLECKGDYDENDIVIWYNGTLIIHQGNALHSTDKRVKFSKKDGSLIIDRIDSFDSGMYKCRLYHKSDHSETNYELKIRGRPETIQIGHNRNEKYLKKEETLTYKTGEKDLRFKCTVGNTFPSAKYSWSHNGNAIVLKDTKDQYMKFVEDNILEITILHAKHAGVYECEATNEYGSIKSSFKIDVQYVPFFSKHHNFFTTELGANTELICAYKSSPAASSVKWFRNGNQIHESSKHEISADMKENHDRTKLTIKDVNANDLGSYHCEVQNSLGTKREEIKVEMFPAPPKFEGFKYINNYLYTDWIVKSYSDIENIIILYRNNVTAWNQTEAKITNKNKVRDGEWKVQGSLSLEAGEWTITGRVKNSNGWSEDTLAQPTVIRIPKDSTEVAEMTSSASSIVSTVFGSLLAVLISRYFV